MMGQTAPPPALVADRETQEALRALDETYGMLRERDLAVEVSLRR
jgi:hypothetical protein